MKNTFLNQIIALLIGTITVIALTEKSIATDKMAANQDAQLSPIALVFHGYQGYFTNQGIPSGATFISAVHFGQIDAEQLVQSAIAKGRLTPETLNDRSYLHKVQTSLKLIERRR